MCPIHLLDVKIPLHFTLNTFYNKVKILYSIHKLKKLKSSYFKFVIAKSNWRAARHI